MNLCINVRLNNHIVKECPYNTMVAKYNLAKNFDSQILGQIVCVLSYI